MKRYLFVIAAAVLCAIPLLAHAEVMDRIVAIVNDEVITLQEVEKYVAVEKKSRYSSMNEYLRNMQLREKLDAFIEGLLINQQARKMKIEVGDREVEATVENIKKQNLVSDAELKEQLKRENISYKDFTEGIKRSLLRNRVLARALERDVKVDEKTLREYYAKHVGEFSQEEYKLQHIFISGQRKDAQERARQAAALLDSEKKTFSEVAAEFSDEAKAQGGDIGFAKKEDLLPELRQAINLLVPGTYTPVLRTPYGFHILKLIEVRKGQAPPFEEVKDAIQEKIFREESEKRFKEYMAKLKSSSYIEVKI
jgi:peptidyl-prolyl cis-trans isomerase SurA